MWYWDLGRGCSFGISDGDVGFWGISYGDVVLGISNGDDEEEAVAMAEEIL
jgi:hypothetical protein